MGTRHLNWILTGPSFAVQQVVHFYFSIYVEQDGWRTAGVGPRRRRTRHQKALQLLPRRHQLQRTQEPADGAPNCQTSVPDGAGGSTATAARGCRWCCCSTTACPSSTASFSWHPSTEQSKARKNENNRFF
jgi:hypothetical protein